jgi:hypothetical protein
VPRPLAMSFPTNEASGILLSIIKKRVDRTRIEKQHIALRVAGGAGLDSRRGKSKARNKTAGEKLRSGAFVVGGQASYFLVLQG